MSAPNSITPPEVTAAAADWLARLDADASARTRADFERWLSADPRHLAAWQELDRAWQIFDRPRMRGEAAGVLRELDARRRRKRFRLTVQATGAAVLAAAAAWFVAVRLPSPADVPALVQNAPGTLAVTLPEKRVLDDGSVVEINRGARLQVVYSTTQRRVRLDEGEAHFTVAKDPARPFIVEAAASETRAVGTEFAVRLQAGRIDLVVTEGKVAFEPTATTAAKASSLLVTAGHRVELPHSVGTLPSTPRPIAIDETEIDQRLAWRAPRLELTEAALADVVAAFNRHNQTRLSIANPALAQWRLSGVFRADRIEEFVQLLEESYGLKVTRQTDGEVVLSGTP